MSPWAKRWRDTINGACVTNPFGIGTRVGFGHMASDAIGTRVGFGQMASDRARNVSLCSHTRNGTRADVGERREGEEESDLGWCLREALGEGVVAEHRLEEGNGKTAHDGRHTDENNLKRERTRIESVGCGRNGVRHMGERGSFLHPDELRRGA